MAEKPKAKAPKKSRAQRKWDELNAEWAAAMQGGKKPGPKRRSKETPKSGNDGRVPETSTPAPPDALDTSTPALFSEPTPSQTEMQVAPTSDNGPAKTPTTLNGLRVELPKLLVKLGSFCQGCGLAFHPDNLQVDHINPKSSGGKDEFQNLTLLCGKGKSSRAVTTWEGLKGCNQRKGKKYTLGWLQDQNRNDGILTAEREKYIQHGKVKG